MKLLIVVVVVVVVFALFFASVNANDEKFERDLQRNRRNSGTRKGQRGNNDPQPPTGATDPLTVDPQQEPLVVVQDSQEDVSVEELLSVQVSSPQEAIDAARNVIRILIDRNERLSPLFLRLGFHDCIGGCDGCVNLDSIDNRGLGRPIRELEPIVEAFAGQEGLISRADIWALAAMTGADVAQHFQNNNEDVVDFFFRWYGRVNCDDDAVCTDEDGAVVPCDGTGGPIGSFPSPDLTTHELLTFFNETFGLTQDESVAIMGAHTLGRLRRENTGFQGSGWVRNNGVLNNAYYAGLVGNDNEDLFDSGPNWVQEFLDNSNIDGIPNRFQWDRRRNRNNDSDEDEEDNERTRRLQGGRRGGGGGRRRRRKNGGGRGRRRGQIMLNVDIALVRDMTGSLDAATGESTCVFQTPDDDEPDVTACPAAYTLSRAALYRFDNTLWLQDFHIALSKMLVEGYETNACEAAVCPLVPSTATADESDQS